MKDKRPPGYRKNEGICKDCNHVFALEEYSETTEYFCTLSYPSDRPRCGSDQLEEYFYEDKYGNTLFEPETEANKIAWKTWADGRGVDELGTCLNWEEKK